MRQSVNLVWKIAVWNAINVFAFFFVADTKVIFLYNFGAPLNIPLTYQTSHIIKHQTGFIKIIV